MSPLLRDITKANGELNNITCPPVRYAGESLKHPSVLTLLILIDLSFFAVVDTVMLPSDSVSAAQ